MEAIWSSETSADFQRTTWRYIAADRTLHNHWCVGASNPKKKLKLLVDSVIRWDRSWCLVPLQPKKPISTTLTFHFDICTLLGCGKPWIFHCIPLLWFRVILKKPNSCPQWSSCSLIHCKLPSFGASSLQWCSCAPSSSPKSSIQSLSIGIQLICNHSAPEFSSFWQFQLTFMLLDVQVGCQTQFCPFHQKTI
jgi:hypothetical protein